MVEREDLAKKEDRNDMDHLTWMSYMWRSNNVDSFSQSIDANYNNGGKKKKGGRILVFSQMQLRDKSTQQLASRRS